MVKAKYTQYYVEGEDDQKVVKTLIGMKLIKPGKVQVINVITQRLTSTRLRTLKNGTMVVLIFDTDRTAYFASTERPFRMSGAGVSVETVRKIFPSIRDL